MVFASSVTGSPDSRMVSGGFFVCLVLGLAGDLAVYSAAPRMIPMAVYH